MIKKRLIGCAVVIDEIKSVLPADMDFQVLDFGLHVKPEDLRKTLQAAIDSAPPAIETIILGYGLCSQAVIGLKSDRCRLIVPRVDDCIAMFLGSSERYYSETKKEPGTYYLTKGWIETGDTLLDEYKRMEAKYGIDKAGHMMKIVLKNFKRIIYIITGVRETPDKYQAYSKELAGLFNLRYEELAGANELLKKMINGNWDNDFISALPGHAIRYEDFKA